MVEVGETFARSSNKPKCILYKWQVDTLQDETITSEYQVELGLHANQFFQTLGDLHREGVTGEELVHTMVSKWEKVVDKVASLTLGCELIVCGRSVKW